MDLYGKLVFMTMDISKFFRLNIADCEAKVEAELQRRRARHSKELVKVRIIL